MSKNPSSNFYKTNTYSSDKWQERIAQVVYRFIKQKFPGLYPSAGLYNHEWQKHGTCSGKTPEQYLALSKKLKDSVAIPTAYNRPIKPFRTTIAGLKTAFISEKCEVIISYIGWAMPTIGSVL